MIFTRLSLLTLLVSLTLISPKGSSAQTESRNANARPSFIVKNRAELLMLKKERDGTPTGPDRSWLTWQLVINAALLDDAGLALTEGAKLKALKNPPVGYDQINLALARVEFGRGQFAKAAEFYESIPRSSEFWFEASEELAWSLIRQNDASAATAKLTTLLTPVFVNLVNPEAYFAASYNALKTCDYVSVFRIGTRFKEHQRERLARLESLAKGQISTKASEALQLLSQGEGDWEKFNAYTAELPRHFWRDKFLRDHRGEKQRQRLVGLAKAELQEFKTVVHKLQLIEAEVIQRLHMDESLKGKRPEAPALAVEKNQITFPYSDELWLDEVDSYRAQVKECPKLSQEARL